MDPPGHTRLRAILQRAFTPRSIAVLEPRIRQISGQLLDDVFGGDDGDTRDVDLVAAYAAPLPMMVMAELLGWPADDWRRLRVWSEIIVNLGVTIVGEREAAGAAAEAFHAANLEMAEAFGELVERRRAAPADDLITRLTSADVDGVHVGEQEILRFVQLLLAAGTEITTNLIDNAVLCLLENPDELTRLRQAPAMLPSAIEEVLRYRSPGQAMFRVARRDLDVGGARIPAGAFVMPMIGAANRDPSVFAEPDRFDVARDPNPHVAFGHGVHFCLGAALSRLEARVALGWAICSPVSSPWSGPPIALGRRAARFTFTDRRACR